MKATDKIIGRLIVGCVFACCLSRFTLQTFAIEGLHVSVQATNAVLSWPSDTNETYIVQFRPDLNAGSSWVTLTNYLPPDADTNLMTYTHSNSVQYPVINSGGSGGGGGGGVPMPGGNGGTNYSSGGGTNGSATTGFYQVVRNGAHIFGMTNGMVLNGTVSLPIELALDSTDEIAGVTFYANGSPLIGASADGDGYHWQLDWDTTMMANGTYDITAEVDFTTQDDTTNTLPVTVTVNNVISFPNYFSRIYGSQMWIYAETIANAPFQLDMYDEGTNYLGSFSGSADGSGVISFIWDLTDGNGNTFDSTNFFGVFTVTTSSTSGNVRPHASSVSTAKKTWAWEWNWTSDLNKYYVVAYAPLTDPSIDPNTSYRQNLAMLGGGEGVYMGVIHALSNYGLGANLSPGNVDQSTAFCLSDATAKTNLLSYLADWHYSNFYFFGHGNASAIGGFGGSGTKIDFYALQKALGNFLHSGKPANYHPYRFVFIDGCSTGAGNFCEAFGIPAQTLNNAFFSGAGVNSRAFLGFKKPKSFPSSSDGWQWYAMMIGGFYEDWQSGSYTVQNCVNRAVSGFWTSSYYTMDSSAIIHGASDLQYNTPTP
jgi:hypothetical protein